MGTNLIYPEAVTADHISQTLFFVNSKAVESVDYNGKQRKQIFSQSNAYFFDIAYHGVRTKYSQTCVKRPHKIMHVYFWLFRHVVAYCCMKVVQKAQAHA